MWHLLWLFMIIFLLVCVHISLAKLTRAIYTGAILLDKHTGDDSNTHRMARNHTKCCHLMHLSQYLAVLRFLGEYNYDAKRPSPRKWVFELNDSMCTLNR